MNAAILVILTMAYILAVIVIHAGDKPRTPGEVEDAINKHAAANAIAMLAFLVALFLFLK